MGVVEDGLVGGDVVGGRVVDGGVVVGELRQREDSCCLAYTPHLIYFVLSCVDALVKLVEL